MGIRDYKIFAPGEYYHIFNRGVGKMDIFRDDQDYKVFLSRLKEYLFPEIQSKSKHTEGHLLHLLQNKKIRYVRKAFPPESFSLIAYCLMPNHFHLLIRQNSDISISKLLLKVCGSYSIYFNKKYERVGSLFQDQFKSERVDKNEYLLWLSAYIHLNPRIAKLVRADLKWNWSSYREYLGTSPENICERGVISEQFVNPDSYNKIVNDAFKPIQSRKDPLLDVLNVEFEFK